MGVYRIGKQLWDRTTGLICALVLASCPQFIFIGKQAITDGPLVGLLTCALALFIVAVFDDEEAVEQASVKEALRFLELPLHCFRSCY